MRTFLVSAAGSCCYMSCCNNQPFGEAGGGRRDKPRGKQGLQGRRVGLIQGAAGRFPGLLALFPTFLSSSEPQISGQKHEIWNKVLAAYLLAKQEEMLQCII